MGTEGPDDGIVATVGLEDNAVGRAESRDVDRVVTGLAIDGDGVEAQACTREVTEDREGVAGSRAATGSRRIDAVDADFLDLT